MRKVAIVFVLAVFVPSLVLAWLALRSLRNQQFVLERQQSLLYQGVTDTMAKEITDYLAEEQRDFNGRVESFLAGKTPRVVAPGFHKYIREEWPLADVGFCVTLTGNFLSPQPEAAETRSFLIQNCGFLGNQEPAEVYSWNGQTRAGNNMTFQQAQVPAAQNGYNANDNSSSTRNSSAPVQLPGGEYVLPKSMDTRQVNEGATANRTPLNANQYQSGDNDNNQKKNWSYNDKTTLPNRKVNPVNVQVSEANYEQNVSKVIPSSGEFAELVGQSQEGMVARFLENKLKLMFWHRSEQDPQIVFGAQLDLSRLINELRPLVVVDPAFAEQICLAVLDDNAKPVAVSNPNFSAMWKRPFVATEIGEALPHWEVGAYLLNPGQFNQAARTAKLTLALLILVLVLAIGIGSWLIVTDLNRQLTLARQKTDFVSNVSHELKTPLTSIRMFSELLSDGRVTDPGKQRSYFNIITAETARLTRLINNVLDFSRMERGEKKYNFQHCDIAKVARDTTESYRPHLENSGFKLECNIAPAELPVYGDCDALAQVIVNLLSNAEKYCNSQKEITVEVTQQDGPLPGAEVKIMDRGLGVPRGSEDRIFEKFYRAHDSLASGIQGSGLGLTLARQIARAHGGDVVYENRGGGGSCFILRLPLKLS